MFNFFIVNNLVEGFELNKLKIKFNIVLMILKYDDVDEVSLVMVFVFSLFDLGFLVELLVIEKLSKEVVFWFD